MKKPEYPSRAIFGKYMISRLGKTLKNTNANIIHQEIVRIDKLSDGWEVEDQSGNIKVYDNTQKYTKRKLW